MEDCSAVQPSVLHITVIALPDAEQWEGKALWLHSSFLNRESKGKVSKWIQVEVASSKKLGQELTYKLIAGELFPKKSIQVDVIDNFGWNCL